MSTITLKNVPTDLHLAMKARAKAHGRSLNREIIAAMEQTVRSVAMPAADVAERARAVRDAMGVYLTQRDLDAARRAGRR